MNCKICECGRMKDCDDKYCWKCYLEKTNLTNSQKNIALGGNFYEVEADDNTSNRDTRMDYRS